MRKVKLFIFLVFSFLVFIEKFDAAECSYKEEIELSKKASLVSANYTYEYVYDQNKLNNKNVKYIINIYNISDGLRIMVRNSLNNDNLYSFNNSNILNNTVTFETFNSDENTTYNIVVLSDTSNCSGSLRTITLVTPKYNEFSQKEECKENPDFKLCSTFYSYSITNSKFESEYKKYIDKKKIKEENKPSIEEKTKEKNLKEKIIEFFNNYKTTILMSLGVILIIGILIIIKKVIDKKRKVI